MPKNGNNVSVHIKGGDLEREVDGGKIGLSMKDVIELAK